MQTVGGNTQRFYPHANHLYSVAALTDSTGAVVERYSYNAYGKQTITGPSGGVRAKSAVGWDRGFTGYVADNETGLLHARARQYSPTLGRFVGRDPKEYIDGQSLYFAYFAPNHLDSNGTACVKIYYWEGKTVAANVAKLPKARWGHVSIDVDGDHMSFWPGETPGSSITPVDPSWKPSVEEDTRLEDGEAPVVLEVCCLDAEKIKAAFQKMRNDKSIKYQFRDGNYNCSSMATQLLLAGWDDKPADPPCKTKLRYSLLGTCCEWESEERCTPPSGTTRPSEVKAWVDCLKAHDCKRWCEKHYTCLFDGIKG